MFALLLIQILLIALNAVFACAEIAVLSVNEKKMARLAQEGNRKAGRVESFLEHPEQFLATIQVAITLSGFLGSAFAADNFSQTLTDWILSLGVSLPASVLKTLSVIAITLILSYFTLVFGELVPKRLAMRKAESLSLSLSGMLSGVSVFFRPLVALLSASTNGVLRLMGIDPGKQEEQATEEEIRMMVEGGTIEDGEKELIRNVFEFNDITARELCTHTMDVAFLELEDSVEQWEDVIHKTRFSLYPIYDEQNKCIIGILDSKDFFRLEKPDKSMLLSIMMPMLFVPESAKADDVLRLMKLHKTKMAAVLDEYGGTEGIITLADITSALVGDVEEDEAIRQTADGVWELHGNVPLSDIEDLLKKDLHSQAETITGYLHDLSEDILRIGTYYADGFTIEIQEIDGRTAAKAILKKLPDSASPANPSNEPENPVQKQRNNKKEE